MHYKIVPGKFSMEIIIVPNVQSFKIRLPSYEYNGFKNYAFFT